MKPQKPRLSKCSVCKTPYQKWNTAQKTCSAICALVLVRADKEKKAKKAHREAKVKAKTRREWASDAQAVFNQFIRKRDSGKLCICCNMPLELNAVGGGFDCGHYRSVGSAPHLRYDPRNAHGQRKQCNRWGSGRAVDYRLGLIKRIGLEEVEALESDQTPRKFTIPDLIEIRDTYRRKLKEVNK